MTSKVDSPLISVHITSPRDFYLNECLKSCSIHSLISNKYGCMPDWQRWKINLEIWMQKWRHCKLLINADEEHLYNMITYLSISAIHSKRQVEKQCFLFIFWKGIWDGFLVHSSVWLNISCFSPPCKELEAKLNTTVVQAQTQDIDGTITGGN